MKRDVLGTHQKALQINLDPTKYGTFAEIGAGQEVARWFFRVGGASGTIAKAISAYDMKFSDAIYGPATRYVSRQRLQTMLEHEFELLQERLHKERAHNTKFFTFADTVAAKSFSRQDEAHGWMGIRFQTEPQKEPSQIIVHVRMLDRENVSQQEALGIMGVNLVHGALYHHHAPDTILQVMMDDLTSDRVEIDVIKFSGPAFSRVDNRLMSLHLVEKGLSNAAMFTADGEVVQADEILHKKAILVERGSFRPVTKVTIDMLECAQAQFIQEPQVQGEEVVVLIEMTMKNLTTESGIDHQDFLARVDILGTMGRTVLISNYLEYYRLAAYLFRYTKKMIGIALGVPTLKEIFDEKYYAHLEGGILESFGRLFKNALKLYIYPLKDKNTGALITAENLQVAPHLRHLYAHLLQSRYLECIHGYNHDFLSIFSREVLAKIRVGDRSWETMVPSQVSQMIRDRQLFGYLNGNSGTERETG